MLESLRPKKQEGLLNWQSAEILPPAASCRQPNPEPRTCSVICGTSFLSIFYPADLPSLNSADAPELRRTIRAYKLASSLLASCNWNRSLLLLLVGAPSLPLAAPFADLSFSRPLASSSTIGSWYGAVRKAVRAPRSNVSYGIGIRIATCSQRARKRSQEWPARMTHWTGWWCFWPSGMGSTSWSRRSSTRRRWRTGTC